MKKAKRKITQTLEFTTEKERTEIVKAITENYFEDNLQRFLRRHYKDYWYELIYSKYLRKLRKSCPVCVNYIREKYQWPKHVTEILNIFRTMVKYYGWAIDLSNLKRAEIIWYFMSDVEIYDYMFDKFRKNAIHNTHFKIVKTEKEKALKEQIARGFIPKTKFKAFDKDYAHVYSNVDRNYIYPLNFHHTYTGEAKTPYSYIGLNLVGVRGWTRVEVPKIEKVKRRRRT